MQRSHLWAGTGLLGLVLLGAGVWWGLGDGAQGPSASPGAQPGAPFVNSMRGTVPDGGLGPTALAPMPDAGGPSGPLPYGELKRMFDYYLSAIGEQSIDAIAQQIRAELDRNLSASQAPAAKRLLARYLDFKRALVDLEQKFATQEPGVQTLRRRFEAMQALRARLFSAEEEQGMFGFEDAYDRDALARLEISQNPKLSAEQKRAQLAVLDAAMPAALKADRDAPRAVIRVEQMAQALRAQGASDDDIYRMRARELDPAAATRLAQVDREEQDWKNRIAVYQRERAKVLKAEGSESERQAALAELRKSQFSEDERKRLAAYEQ